MSSERADVVHRQRRVFSRFRCVIKSWYPCQVCACQYERAVAAFKDSVGAHLSAPVPSDRAHEIEAHVDESCMSRSFASAFWKPTDAGAAATRPRLWTACCHFCSNSPRTSTHSWTHCLHWWQVDIAGREQNGAARMQPGIDGGIARRDVTTGT